MWIASNDGFISIVELKDDPTCLMVRARRRAHLEAFLSSRKGIVETKSNDYRWRSIVPRVTVAKLLADRVPKLDYPNFKDSVKDKELHDMYLDWWFDHRAMQERKPGKCGRRKQPFMRFVNRSERYVRKEIAK